MLPNLSHRAPFAGGSTTAMASALGKVNNLTELYGSWFGLFISFAHHNLARTGNTSPNLATTVMILPGNLLTGFKNQHLGLKRQGSINAGQLHAAEKILSKFGSLSSIKVKIKPPGAMKVHVDNLKSLTSKVISDFLDGIQLIRRLNCQKFWFGGHVVYIITNCRLGF